MNIRDRYKNKSGTEFIMTHSLLMTVMKVALLGRATVMTSSYQFDPMNNSWKPSAGQHRRHHTSSSASSYSYAPAEPTPYSGVGFSYDEDDIIRHNYAGWGPELAHRDSLDPAFVPKESLVQIEYNKKTGEVSLQDEDGIVTKEQYERLMKAIKSTGVEDGTVSSTQQQDGVAVGTTSFLDIEELDLTDIIDTQGEDLSSEIRSDTPQENQGGSQHHNQYQYQEYPQQHVEPAGSGSFNSYSIPTPDREINHPVQRQPAGSQVTVHVQQYHQPSQYFVPSQPGPSAQHYYQTHSHSQQQSVASSPATSVASSSDTTNVAEQDAEENIYRRSRGFGFAHRRQSFAD